MLLSINKSYNITSKKETIIKKKVKIVAIVNYEETSLIASNLHITAINEQVVPSTTDVHTYLNSVAFYKCEYIDEPSTYMILWDDIIDRDKSSELSSDIRLIVDFDVNVNNGDITVNELKTKINEIASQFPDGDVKISITSAGTSTGDTSFDSIEDQLNTAMTTLTSYTEFAESQLRARTLTESLVEKLEETNVVGTLNSILETAQATSDVVTEIYDKVK